MGLVEDATKKITDAAKKLGVSDSTINKVAGVNKAVTGALSGGSTTRTAAEAAASGDFETPFNGNQTYGRKLGTRLEDYAGTSSNFGKYQNDLDKLTKAKRQAQVDALKAARTKALANLNAQEQEIKPQYQNARNLTSASSQQGARNFAEYLANRGLANSGAAAQAEINRQSSLINNLGNINTAEANALRDIANQRTGVENQYVADLANANNQITSDYYDNLLKYNEQQRQYVQNLQNQALGQYADDYQARINELLAQGYSPNSMEVLQLQALRGNKVNNQYSNAMANAQNNILAGNINYNNAAQLGMTVPQAQQYYETYQAAQQAQKQAKADALQREIQQQNFKNELEYYNYLLNQQKVANDTAQTNYNINKPYYKPTVAKTTTDSGVTGLIQNLIARGYSDQEIADLING